MLCLFISCSGNEDKRSVKPLPDPQYEYTYERIDAFTRAMSENDMRRLRNMLDDGFDPNHLIGGSRTSGLSAAASFGYIDSLKVLIEYGANVNSQALITKRTPLHEAVYYGNEQDEVVHILLNAGADPNLKDSDGKTPLDYAIQQRYTRSIRLLQNHTK